MAPTHCLLRIVCGTVCAVVVVMAKNPFAAAMANPLGGVAAPSAPAAPPPTPKVVPAHPAPPRAPNTFRGDFAGFIQSLQTEPNLRVADLSNNNLGDVAAQR